MGWSLPLNNLLKILRFRVDKDNRLPYSYISIVFL